MSFDEQPDAPIHGECAIEIHRLEAKLAASQARVQNLREVVEQYQVAGFGESTSIYEQGIAYDMAIKELATSDTSAIKEIEARMLEEAAKSTELKGAYMVSEILTRMAKERREGKC